MAQQSKIGKINLFQHTKKELPFVEKEVFYNA